MHRTSDDADQARRRPAEEADEQILEAALDDYLHAIASGSPVDREEWIAAYPAIAAPLRQRLGALDFLMGRLGTAVDKRQSPCGDTLGVYRILRELGRGGQGAVYLAEDTRIHRQVALKRLLRLGPDSDPQLRRFRREAEVAARLQHPGICPVYDVGVADGEPFIAMPYVAGEPLSEWITTRRRANAESGGRRRLRATQLPPVPRSEIDALLRLFEKIARALHAAHEAGILHRDVKPGNVMVTPQGEPVLLDFGLAGLVESADSAGTRLTRTGDLFGTPAYMAPEQVDGDAVRIDARSDVYSLGVSLYECVTLERPFDAPTRGALYHAILTGAPRDPRKLNRDVSDDLRVVLDTALEKDRDRRYGTAEAFADDLRALLEHRPIRARRIGVIGRLARWLRREPAIATVLLALPVIAVLTTAYLKDRPYVEAARRARIAEEKEALLAAASAALTEGRSGAIRLFEQVLAMEGTSPEAVVGLAVAWLRARCPAEALALLDQHAGLLPDGVATRVCRAKALRELGRADEAQGLLAAVPPVDSAFDHEFLAMNTLADCASCDATSLREALRHATAAILLSPTPRLAMLDHRAHAAAHLHQRQIVLDTIAAIRSLWPNSRIAHRAAGRALVKLGERDLFDTALECFRAAIRLQPDARDYWYVGNVLAAQGSLDAAIAAYRQAIAATAEFAEGHIGLARALQRKGESDAAIEALEQVIRLQPKVASHHCDLGDLLDAKGRRDDAIAAYRAAIELDPRSGRAHCNLASIRYEKGLIDEAIAGFRAAIQADPALARPHYNLGLALAAKDLLEEAIAEQRQAIGLDPAYGAAHHRLAIALHRKGLLEEAVPSYREAARLLPDDAEVQNDLATALGALGLFAEAADAARTAVRLRPDHALAHYNLGVALDQLGYLADACHEWRTAVDLEPGRAELWMNLGAGMGDSGRYREALDCCRRAHELASQRADYQLPTAQAVAHWQRRVAQEQQWQQRLAARLASGTEPDRSPELLALARTALAQGGAEVAARWYVKAFEQDSAAAADLEASHRRSAAAAAVTVACIDAATSGTATADIPSLWRERALRWLQAELQQVQAGCATGTLAAPAVRRALVPLVREPAFAPVRDAEALQAVPEPERVEWRELWNAIDSMLESLEPPATRVPSTEKPRAATPILPSHDSK